VSFLLDYFFLPECHFVRAIVKRLGVPVSERLPIKAGDDAAVVFRNKIKLVECLIDFVDIFRIHPFAVRRIAEKASACITCQVHILHRKLDELFDSCISCIVFCDRDHCRIDIACDDRMFFIVHDTMQCLFFFQVEQFFLIPCKMFK